MCTIQSCSLLASCRKSVRDVADKLRTPQNKLEQHMATHIRCHIVRVLAAPFVRRWSSTGYMHAITRLSPGTDVKHNTMQSGSPQIYTTLRRAGASGPIELRWVVNCAVLCWLYIVDLASYKSTSGNVPDAAPLRITRSSLASRLVTTIRLTVFWPVSSVS